MSDKKRDSAFDMMDELAGSISLTDEQMGAMEHYKYHSSPAARDASLLLDEVKRLRSENKRLQPEASAGAATSPICVWWFDDAPQELRDLSPHGGDEDWLGEFPPWCSDFAPWWSHAGTAFGVCDVSEHAHPTKPGWTVRIGAHA